jgi:hypothetical protein
VELFISYIKHFLNVTGRVPVPIKSVTGTFFCKSKVTVRIVNYECSDPADASESKNQCFDPVPESELELNRDKNLYNTGT